MTSLKTGSAESEDAGQDVRSGEVTAIRAQSGSSDRVSVFIDDRFAFGMHRDLLLEFDVTKGVALDVEAQLEIVRRDAFFKARSAAYAFLSYRDRSTAEVRRRLRRSEYDDDVIEDVVHYLDEADLIDDHRFAVSYAEGRFHSGGYGPMRVRADLRRKGVKSAAVDAAIEEVFAERDELFERARTLGRKRWRRYSDEMDVIKRKKRVYDYLARRGFRYEMVHRIIDDLEDEA